MKIASPPSPTTEFPNARSFAERRMARLCLWRCGLFKFTGTAVVSFWRSATRPNRGFLEHAFLDAADREQRRIGKEMHDHLCQQILGAAFAVKALAGDLGREGSRHAEQLHELARMVNETVSQVRDISRTLHPVELESGELQSAIEGLAGRMKNALPCQFHCAGDVPRPSAQSALHAYRIIQETISHALHHTGATKVSIRLSTKGDSLRIEIFDNGTKEGPLTADANHIASKTLRYRAKAIRGQLRLKFHNGIGTSVGCTFPQTS